MRPQANNSKKVNQASHYHRQRSAKSAKLTPKKTWKNRLSPRIYLPLLILGVLVVIYAIWNPFTAPALTINHQEIQATAFKKLRVKAEIASVYPEKAGGRKVKFIFSGNKITTPIVLKDSLTVISKHGVLTFKANDKYLDLSTGEDSISGVLYGVNLPQEKIAIQIFADQQKLLVQSDFQELTFPLKLRNLYLQGNYQKNSAEPMKQVGLYLTSNTHYEGNVAWKEQNQTQNRTEHFLNVANGVIDTKIEPGIIRYYLRPEETVQAVFYQDPLTQKDITTKLNRYVAGIKIPPNYQYSWEIEYKDNQYSLIYYDQNQQLKRANLSPTKTGTFVRFSQALDIPDPVAPTTQVTSVESTAPASPPTPSTTPKPAGDVSQTAPQEVQQRLLALLLKKWPTQLNPSQIKLFTITNQVNQGTITYTYTTNGKKNPIQVMQYVLKNDGTIDYKATSPYSPNSFRGNIFSEVDQATLSRFFPK